MSQNIIFITAFKDIGRGDWMIHKRTNDDYINYFLNLAKNIDYTLIVYVDNDIKEYIFTKYSDFRNNIIFKNFSDVNTFYEKYLESERNVLGNSEFQNKIPKHRFRKHPETWSAKYNLINHSKVNFISYSKKIYPNYEYYCWIDFGFVRDQSSLPKNLNLSKFPEKIIYQAFEIPEKKIDANEMLKINEAKIAGSTFIVPKELVEKYESIYENKIIEWQQHDLISDDDQSLVLQLYYDNNELFNLILDPNWFLLFKHLQ
jgi:hypothetical protein